MNNLEKYVDITCNLLTKEHVFKETVSFLTLYSGTLSKMIPVNENVNLEQFKKSILECDLSDCVDLKDMSQVLINKTNRKDDISEAF